MLSETDNRSAMVLVLSIIMLVLIFGAFTIDIFNRKSFHKSSYELLTDSGLNGTAVQSKR